MSGKRVLLPIVLALSLFVAATGIMAAKSQVTVWLTISQTNATEFLQGVVDRFHAANPDINVEIIEAGGYYASFDKLLVTLAGGAAPNLALIEQSLVYALVINNGAVDLTPYIERDPTMALSDFDPALRSTVTFEGRMFGIPYNVSTPVLYYNENVMMEAGLEPIAPRNREEFLALARRTTLAGSDGKIQRFGFYLTAWRWLFEAWIGRSGARIMDANGSRFTFDSPTSSEILQFAQDLVHRHRVAGYGSGTSAAHRPFFEGKLTMMEYSTAGLEAIQAGATTAGFSLGVAPLPCYAACYVPIGARTG